MILHVPVATDLFEELLTTGHEIHGVLRVKEGLPKGAKLLSADLSMNVGGPVVLLSFMIPGDGESRLTDIIVEKSTEVEALAHELAEETSASLVSSCSSEVERDGETWLEIGEHYMAGCTLAIRYLKMRDLLTQHPSELRLVKLLCQEDEDEVQEVPR